jgi:hypothetical protein
MVFWLAAPAWKHLHGSLLRRPDGRLEFLTRTATDGLSFLRALLILKGSAEL